MLYFFQNNVVPQFFNGMVCWHYHLQWICGYVHVYKIIKQLLEWRTAHRSRAWNSSDSEVREQSTVSLRRLFLKFSCNQLKISCLGAGDDLGTVVFGLRPQATVLKSSPAPWINSFDCYTKIEAQHCFERNTAFDRNDALRIVRGHGTVRIRK
jgi:hypothetical protein